MGFTLAALGKTIPENQYFSGTSLFGSRSSLWRSMSARPQPSLPRDLTFREKEVLVLLSEEYTSKEIASRLGVSALTVETHRANLLRKTGVRNAVGLALFAVRHGLIRLEPEGPAANGMRHLSGLSESSQLP